MALAAAALSYISFGPKIGLDDLLYVAFVFFGTLSAYNYMRWVKSLNNYRQNREPKLRQQEKINWFHFGLALPSGLVAFILLFLLGSTNLIFYIFPAVLIALVYPIAFPHPNRAFTSLRMLPGLKLFLIAGSWTYLSFAIPYWMHEGIDMRFFTGEFIFRTLFVMGLTIPFDIRDIDSDEETMRTVPQVFGKENAISLAILGLFLYQVWIVIQFFLFAKTWFDSLATLVALEVGISFIKALKERNTTLLVNFWIESIPIIILILTSIAGLAFGNSYF